MFTTIICFFILVTFVPRHSVQVRQHLELHDFKVSLRGTMPAFHETTGEALLKDPRGKKRGNTGMIFVASRKAAMAAIAGDAGPYFAA